MYRFALLFAILSIAQAHAETQPRCGTDAFGNTVCMDKDGVLSIAPREAAAGMDEAGAASAVAADGKDDEPEVRRRCSVDPFGNNVCREW